ncbi:hypothetical protein EW146_g4481 [Bondarzewia mesenterica]|uniref:ASTRA-associated protein 1 n=1 Tax=Bondarzewia mesenterica TaxID=1095465 RepID=A0A4S4LVK2_9AGAM|nr:hypothetical protein EW146_g4481 [Bondarzewia mesenterica]
MKADIWVLPSRERLHAAIGKGQLDVPIMPGTDGRGVKNATGIIMSMHLMPEGTSSEPSSSHSESRFKRLRLLASYENGSVAMWQYRADKERSVEGIGWARCWTAKLHVESVMAMAVSIKYDFALSVSADHIIVRYDLAALNIDANSVSTSCSAHRTKHPGNGSIVLRDDGRVCAVGGWDGKIRLYSTKTLKPLGTLVYHKDNAQALAWARPADQSLKEEIKGQQTDLEFDSDDEMTAAEKERRERWLVSGGKDGRVAIWELMDFGGKR